MDVGTCLEVGSLKALPSIEEVEAVLLDTEERAQHENVKLL